MGGKRPLATVLGRAYWLRDNAVPLYKHINAQHECDEPVEHRAVEYIVCQDEVRRHLNSHKGHDYRDQHIPQAVQIMVVKTHRVSYEFGVCGYKIPPSTAPGCRGQTVCLCQKYYTCSTYGVR